jgi:PAS domain S-box-containing protein
LELTAFERERLEMLRKYQVFDLEPDNGFDAVTRLAKRLFSVPAAVICFVDTKGLWVKSYAGEQPAKALAAWPVCNRVLLQREPLVIGDIEAAEEVDDIPFYIDGQPVRSFAGVPISAREGIDLGVLLVLDTQPRSFTEEEKVLLEDLARMAVRDMELRREVTDRERMEIFQQGSDELLEMIAGGSLLGEVLDSLVQFIELHAPGSNAAIMLLDEASRRLWCGAAPGLPAEFTERLEGLPVGSDQASCGAAVFLKEPVIAADVATDFRWEGLREIAQQCGIKACWSWPIVSSNGMVLGTIALYYEVPGRPGTGVFKLIEIATHLAWLALERARSAAILEERERNFRLFAEHARDIIARLTPETAFIYSSPSIQQILGYTPEEVEGQPALSLIHPEDVPHVAEAHAMVLKGFPRTVTCRVRHRRGHYIWAEASCSILRDESSGRVDEVHMLARDITERKAAEEAIQAAEAKFRALVEQSLTGVFIVADEQFVYVNPRFADVFGYTQEEILSLSARDLVLEEDWHLVEGSLRRSMVDEEGKIRFSYRGKRKAGNVISVEVHGTRTEFGGRPAMLGTLLDVTERTLAEQALRQSESFLDSIVENLPIMIFVKDAKTLRFVRVNRAGEEFMGIKRDQILNKTDWEIFPPDTAELCARTDLHAIQQGKLVLVTEEVIPTVHNGHRITSTRKLPIMNAEGHPQYLLGISQDVTDRKRYERELVESKERAEEMNKLKTAFLANMSHEIRTPLASIIGFSEILAGEIGEEKKDLANLINSSGRRLLETLNSVLDLAQLESRSLSLNPQMLNIVHETRDVLALFRTRAEAAGLTLDIQCHEPDIWLSVDRAAFGRVLSNLVANAIKFTNEGGVSVSLRRDGRFLELAVSDTGIGIDPEFMPLLFDEFKQESTGLARNFEGSGLGLTITRRLLDIMGGFISVESQKHKGSTFTIRLPIGDVSGRVEDDAEMEEEPDWGDRQPRLLVVEDFHHMRTLLQHMLQSDYVLETAATYDEALAKAEGGVHDVVLLDIHLGEGKNGIDVLKALREIPAYQSIPIIACTAFALPGDHVQFIKAGFDGYVSKPFQRKDLMKAFRRGQLAVQHRQAVSI